LCVVMQHIGCHCLTINICILSCCWWIKVVEWTRGPRMAFGVFLGRLVTQIYKGELGKSYWLVIMKDHLSDNY